MTPAVTQHHVTVEAQTWRNVPPYPSNTMRRAACKCGWRGLWHTYEENDESECPLSPRHRGR